jgi:rRNA maturation endonuclease Nob1
MKRGKISKLLGKVEKTSDKLLILGNDAVSISPSLKQFMIKKIKAVVATEEDFFCNKCGTKQVESDSRFCSKCGNPLQPPIES